MIISRAPFRISLAGGGSDLKAYFQRFGGQVFSFTINKYVYSVLHKHSLGSHKIKYSKTEDVQNLDEIKHPLVREVLKEIKPKDFLEIATFADVPSSGTGLGSSSAFTISLLNAVSKYNDLNLSKQELANIACEIEINRCGEPIGKQDQFASAFGGINHFKFNCDGSTTVTPLPSFDQSSEFLGSCLSLFYLGYGRTASSILQEQAETLKNNVSAIENVSTLKKLVLPTINAVIRQDAPLLGSLIKQGWELKSGLARNISSEEIESIIASTRNLGAYGAKIVGAGGGGFLLVCHEPGARSFFASRLGQLQHLEFELDKEGAQIVYSD